MLVLILRAQTQALTARPVKTLKIEIIPPLPSRKSIFSLDVFSYISSCRGRVINRLQCSGFQLWVWLVVSLVQLLVREQREDTWDDLWLRGCSEGHGWRLGLPFLILCHHVDIVFCVPVQPPENHMLTAAGQPDFRFPLRRLDLKIETSTFRSCSLSALVMLQLIFSYHRLFCSKRRVSKHFF